MGTHGWLPAAAVRLFHTRVSDQPASVTGLTAAHMSPSSPPSPVQALSSRVTKPALLLSMGRGSVEASVSSWLAVAVISSSPPPQRLITA